MESVNLERESEEISIKNASYSLISSTDNVLANQTIGGYGSKLVITPSFDTIRLLKEFVQSYNKDIIQILGIE